MDLPRFSFASIVTRALAACTSTLFLGTSVTALSLESRIYREDYEAETVFPTTPEEDVLGIAGMSGFDTLLTGEPALQSGAAQVFASGPINLEGTAIDTAATLGANDFGLRGQYANVTMVGDGTAFAGLSSAVEITRDAISVGVRMQRQAGNESAELRVSLVSGADGVTVIAEAFLALSGREAAALLGGAAFTLDLFVDRGSNRALGSIRVDGYPETPPVDIDLFGVGTSAIASASQLGGFDRFATQPSSVELDLTAFEVHSELLRSFNIDVGTGLGTPSNSFGAAGPAGPWTEIGVGTTLLTDTLGIPSGASALLITSSAAGSIGPGATDAEQLLGDYGFDCAFPSVWSLQVTGLAETAHDVIVYAPADTQTISGAIRVNGNLVGDLDGDPTFALVEGVSWKRVVTSAPGGAITVSGSEGSPLCAGVSGLQIVARAFPAVPGLSDPFALAAVALLLCGLAGHALRGCPTTATHPGRSGGTGRGGEHGWTRSPGAPLRDRARPAAGAHPALSPPPPAAPGACGCRGSEPAVARSRVTSPRSDRRSGLR
ncbi:MAG: hypothetical protein AAF430_09565 [Myxococcota bacterium]